MPTRDDEYYRSLVRELSALPAETEWVEFKMGNADPERIAKYISGISNSAALADKPAGYLIWGIDDSTHEIIGTNFRYRSAKKGNEELEAWLSRVVEPKIGFSFHEIDMDEGAVATVLEIPQASREPTKVGSQAFIRIGSTLKPLAAHKELEARLWRAFETLPAEMRIAARSLPADKLSGLLDFPGYYKALDRPTPSTRNEALSDLERERFIVRNDAGTWDVTNLGALSIAEDLSQFDDLSRRSIRVIRYEGTSRSAGKQERSFSRGYALDFGPAIMHIMAVSPQSEIAQSGIRKANVAFPEVVVRELLANAVIHQSLDQKGTNPMVEVFSDRIEFSNAGAPLIKIDRIVNTVPVSRDERIRTCYMQACLARVGFGAIGNADVRRTFGIDDAHKAQATRIIDATKNAGLLKPIDPNTAPRYMLYVPYWA